jgi:hypothetical protein
MNTSTHTIYIGLLYPTAAVARPICLYNKTHPVQLGAKIGVVRSAYERLINIPIQSLMMELQMYNQLDYLVGGCLY